jgi:hypothetical protein
MPDGTTWGYCGFAAALAISFTLQNVNDGQFPAVSRARIRESQARKGARRDGGAASGFKAKPLRALGT